MAIFIQALMLSVIGVILIWFGYTIFFLKSPSGAGGENRRRSAGPPQAARGDGGHRPQRQAGGRAEGPPAKSGTSQSCPVCSAQLARGEQVQSSVFPKFPGQDRIMHISGCVYCRQGGRPRTCPVCGASLGIEEFLVARLFEKPGRSHVHVLGCKRCR